MDTAPADLEPVAPPQAFLNRIEDLLVVCARHVDARAMPRQVAGEGETTARAMVTCLAALDAVTEEVIASDAEQAGLFRILTSIPGVSAVTAAALLCRMPDLGGRAAHRR